MFCVESAHRRCSFSCVSSDSHSRNRSCTLNTLMCVLLVQRHEPNSSFSPSASTAPEGLRKVRDDKGHLSAVTLLSSPPVDGCQLGQALSIPLIPFIFITPFSFCPGALFMLPRQYIEFCPDTSIR